MVELLVYADEDTAAAKTRKLYSFKMEYKAGQAYKATKRGQANLYVNRELAIVLLRNCDEGGGHGIKAFTEDENKKDSYIESTVKFEEGLHNLMDNHWSHGSFSPNAKYCIAEANSKIVIAKLDKLNGVPYWYRYVDIDDQIIDAIHTQKESQKWFTVARRIKFESDQHVRILTGNNRDIVFEVIESNRCLKLISDVLVPNFLITEEMASRC